MRDALYVGAVVLCGTRSIFYVMDRHMKHICVHFVAFIRKRGSSVVRHLPLVLDVSGSIPARVEENFGVRTRFL